MRSRPAVSLVVLLMVSPFTFADAGKHVPTVDDLFAIKSLGGVQLSPDGRFVAYGGTETDFKQDAYVTQLWLAPTAGGAPFQLTRGPKSSENARWSPDARRLAFTSTRAGDKAQIFVLLVEGGEAQQLTKSETGVTSYAWS